MHKYPFTLVRIVRYDQEGNPAFKHPLWLIVMGERRQELTLKQIVEAYTTRFDEEHFSRFGKQKMLLVDFETPGSSVKSIGGNWFTSVMPNFGWAAICPPSASAFSRFPSCSGTLVELFASWAQPLNHPNLGVFLPDAQKAAEKSGCQEPNGRHRCLISAWLAIFKVLFCSGFAWG